MNDFMYIFVEGQRDSFFITKIFIEKLLMFGDNYSIIQYAQKKCEKVNKYIKSIDSMPYSDYIFISDQDGDIYKKDSILSDYAFVDENKLFISIYEIESWIIAGISSKITKKYKIKPIGSDTSKITKEKFKSMVPPNMSENEFVSYILEDFNIEKAAELNASFRTFLEYLTLKKAS